MYARLSRGVQTHRRGAAANERGKPPILNNQSVHPRSASGLHHPHGLRQLALFDQRIHCQMNSHPAGMTVAAYSSQGFQRKILRVLSGMKRPRPQIHGVRSAAYSGLKRLLTPRRSKQLYRAESGQRPIHSALPDREGQPSLV